MKAAICTRYGPPEVVEIQEVQKPAPKDNELLIKIRATTVTSGDDRLRGGKVPLLIKIPFRLMAGITGLRSPVLGTDLAGVVEAVGKDVKRFQVGDEVMGSAGHAMGCHAEYICLGEDEVLTHKPPDIPFTDGAALFFGGHTALHFLRKADIQKGRHILIYGASGCIGTYAVQMAKHFGARVTGVCSSLNMEMVKSLGADEVMDYRANDFSLPALTYDIVFDAVGHSPFSGSVRSLKKGGIYLRAVHITLVPILKGLWTSLFRGRKVVGGEAGETLEDLEFLTKLALAGDLKPVIDKTYPLDQIVEAHRLVDDGRKKGSVVVTMREAERPSGERA